MSNPYDPLAPVPPINTGITPGPQLGPAPKLSPPPQITPAKSVGVGVHGHRPLDFTEIFAAQRITPTPNQYPSPIGPQPMSRRPHSAPTVSRASATNLSQQAASVSQTAAVTGGRVIPAMGGGGRNLGSRFLAGAGGFGMKGARGASKVAKGAFAFGRYGTKMGVAGLALGLIGGGAVALVGAPFELAHIGRSARDREEAEVMRNIGMSLQVGPFGSGDRPYGMGSNFNNSAGMTLALHYASHGSGIRNPLWGLASKATGISMQSGLGSTAVTVGRLMGGY